MVDRDTTAIQARCSDPATSTTDVGGVGVDGVDHQVRAASQRQGQVAFTATEIQAESVPDFRLGQNLLGRLPINRVLVRGAECRRLFMNDGPAFGPVGKTVNPAAIGAHEKAAIGDGQSAGRADDGMRPCHDFRVSIDGTNPVPTTGDDRPVGDDQRMAGRRWVDGPERFQALDRDWFSLAVLLVPLNQLEGGNCLGGGPHNVVGPFRQRGHWADPLGRPVTGKARLGVERETDVEEPVAQRADTVTAHATVCCEMEIA